ncbi:hypothetical protein BDW69DRAFT_177829 [Aspergillus filifer]
MLCVIVTVTSIALPPDARSSVVPSAWRPRQAVVKPYSFSISSISLTSLFLFQAFVTRSHT